VRCACGAGSLGGSGYWCGAVALFVALVGVAMDPGDKVDYWGTVGARQQQTNGCVWAVDWGPDSLL